MDDSKNRITDVQNNHLDLQTRSLRKNYARRRIIALIIWNLALSIGLISLAVFCGIQWERRKELEDDVRQFQSNLQTLRRVASISDLEATSNTLDNLKDELRDVATTLGDVQMKVLESNRKLDSTSQKVEGLENQVNMLSNSIDDVRVNVLDVNRRVNEVIANGSNTFNVLEKVETLENQLNIITTSVDDVNENLVEANRRLDEVIANENYTFNVVQRVEGFENQLDILSNSFNSVNATLVDTNERLWETIENLNETDLTQQTSVDMLSLSFLETADSVQHINGSVQENYADLENQLAVLTNFETNTRMRITSIEDNFIFLEMVVTNNSYDISELKLHTTNLDSLISRADVRITVLEDRLWT
ncbi:uncharacterized protein LOC142350242 isoform X2 [Convolutriloba macropyga]|uniref:uncharacterized protein LOC142350242 isoform X2 n=1 Tax=Convolutriloba macropyga TaxID=536237 RepID=UPI003F51C7D2